MGIVDGEDTSSGDDLSLFRILGASRRAGITKQMLPLLIVGSYVQALQELVRIELDLFRRGVVPRAGEDLAPITAVATRLSEQLVVLIRRKLLLPTLGALVVAGMARALMVAFYERHLRGNAAYDTYLTGADATARYVTTSQATIVSK